jgi:hypothetical protein
VPSAIAVERVAPAPDPALAAALQTSLDTITAPGAAPGACGSAVPIVIPLNGRSLSRRVLQTRATATGRIDRDTVRVFCSASP